MLLPDPKAKLQFPEAEPSLVAPMDPRPPHRAHLHSTTPPAAARQPLRLAQYLPAQQAPQRTALVPQHTPMLMAHTQLLQLVHTLRVPADQHRQHQALHPTQVLMVAPLRHLRLVLILVAPEAEPELALAAQQPTVRVHQFTQALTVAHTQLLQLAH